MKAAVGACWIALVFATLPAEADIRVWTEKDQQGDLRHIRQAVRDLKRLDFDDAISSLQADEPWLVCSEPLFRGDCLEVEGNVSNLRLLGMNNRITSLRPAPPPPPEPAAPTRPARKTPTTSPAPGASPPAEREWWRGDDDAAVFTGPQQKARGRRAPRIDLYERPNYKGHRLRLDGPVEDVADLGQPVGSLVVRTGSWQVCSDPSFQGRCQVLDATADGLADVADIGSLRPTPEAD